MFFERGFLSPRTGSRTSKNSRGRMPFCRQPPRMHSASESALPGAALLLRLHHGVLYRKDLLIRQRYPVVPPCRKQDSDTPRVCCLWSIVFLYGFRYLVYSNILQYFYSIEFVIPYFLHLLTIYIYYHYSIIYHLLLFLITFSILYMVSIQHNQPIFYI